MTRPFPIPPTTLVLTALCTLVACSSAPTDPIVCDASMRVGITVTIKDAETLAPLAAAARGVVRDGAYEDSLVLVAPLADARGAVWAGRSVIPALASACVHSVLARPRGGAWLPTGIGIPIGAGRLSVEIGRNHRPRQHRRAGVGGPADSFVRLTGGAGPEVREDLVDHRRLGDAGDDAHRAVAGRARQRGMDVVVYEPVIDTPTFFNCHVERCLDVFNSESDLIVANRLSPMLADVREKVFTRDIFGGDR